MRRYITKSGMVPGYSPSQLVLAADAALNAAGSKTGMAYLGTDGTWGVVLRPVEGPNLSVCVLRAVHYALDRELPHNRITVLTDVREAYACLSSWKRGLDLYPGGYSPDKHGTHLIALREKIVSAPRRYAFTLTQAENPLTEFTDSAARLAVRLESGLRGRLEVSQQAPRWAKTRLQEWGASQEER